MEVAFNQTSLLPRKQQRLVQLPGEKNLSIHMNTSVSSQNGSPKASTSTNGVSQQIPQSTARQLDVQIPSSSASDVTDPSPALMSFTPPPETDSQKDIAEPARSPAEQSEKVTNGEGVEKKRRKRRSKLELISTEGMKSRITRNRDDPNTEVVNNYVDSTEKKFVRPRVVAPVGIVRQPFKPPKGDLEKEKDKLKIHMVGPKTKTSMNVIESMNRPNRQHNTISEGSDFQANFDQYLAEEFVKPVTKIDDIPDRDDEVMWKDNRVLLKDKERELDDAWKAVRRQFNGKVGIDAMLHRLMLCDYNIELMLTTIEKELLELPQPFEELNEGQQAEFEKLLRKPGIHHGKSFRNMQERFLKGYYLGEIVQYYYDTKHRGCPHTLYHRCQCKQNLVHEFPSVQRFECYNCTKYIWKEIYPERSSRSQSLCPVCDHFYAIRRQHRVGMEKLTESEEKLARTMVELEKQLKQPVSKIEVFAYLEKQRLEKLNARSVAEEVPAQYHNRKPIKTSVTELAELSKKFVPKKDSKCWTTHKWGSSARQFMLKTYSVEEKKLLIKAFQKHGLQYEKIAEELQRFSSCEVEVFYGRFHQELSLDKLVHPQKKEIWLGHASLSRLTGGRPSNSPTPEPTGRRKRAISTDPNYEAYRNVNGPPLPKSTRRTRQTQVVAPVENEENESHSNPAPTVS